MVDQDRPRVKLPDHIIRKPVVPGLNSWAQAQQQQQQHSAYDQKSSVAVTNRDKYEDKPMPPPPPDEISPPRLQPRTYIQPAIPLVNQVPISKTPKNRAVTDPVAPRPLFAGRKISVNQLRKKCSTSKGKAEAPKDEGKDDGDPTTSARLPSENAAQVLGLYLVQDNKRNTPPPSAPTSKVPDPFRISYEDPPERNDTPARQVQSTPVPTRRYLTENGLPTSTLIEPSNASQRQVNEPGPNKHDQTRDTDDQAPVNGMLRPPKVGAFVNFGEIGVVQENVMHRIDSFRGIIEDAGPTNGYGDHTATTSSEAPSQLGTDRGQDSRNILVSSMYTPGNYGGVWENDPAVVSTSNRRCRLDSRM